MCVLVLMIVAGLVFGWLRYRARKQRRAATSVRPLEMGQRARYPRSSSIRRFR